MNQTSQPPKNRWALYVAGIAAAASTAGLYFGGGLNGTLTAVAVSALFLPLMFVAFLFWWIQKHAGQRKWLEVLAAVVVAVMAVYSVAASGLSLSSVYVGRPLDWRIRPPQPVYQEVHVTVPVSAAILDAVPDLNDTTTVNEGNGFFWVPPRTRARCARVALDKWTIDPLDTIEAMFSVVQVAWPMDAWRQAFREHNSDVESFWTEYVMPQYQELVREHLVSNAEASVIEAFKQEYQRLLVPALQDSCGTCTSSGVCVFDARKPPARPFWKRMIAKTILDADPSAQERIFGPYYPTAAGTGRPSPNPQNKFPAPLENMGCLLALDIEAAPSGSLRPRGAPTRFYDPNCVVTNDTANAILVRLGINDNMAEDNGNGCATVTIQLEPL